MERHRAIRVFWIAIGGLAVVLLGVVALQAYRARSGPTVQHLYPTDIDHEVDPPIGQKLVVSGDPVCWTIGPSWSGGEDKVLRQTSADTFVVVRPGSTGLIYGNAACRATNGQQTGVISVEVVERSTSREVHGGPALPPGGLVTHP